MLFDSHTHSSFSFDGHHSPRELCAAAVQQGVTGFVITDHYDIDGVLDGLYPDYDADSAARAIEEAREEFSSQVEIYRGIELGQGGLRPEEAKAFLRKYHFDFVITSCHNLANVPDFYFMDFTSMPQALTESLYRRMLEEFCLHAAIPGVHTAAHISYPLRYMAKGGRSVDLSIFTDHLRRLYGVMRDNGVAMELNTKGLWTGGITAETELWLLRLWRECGGEDVTIGSDAHRAPELGRGVRDGYALLREAGFAWSRFRSAKGMSHRKID